jgi:hypothetical protein
MKSKKLSLYQQIRYGEFPYLLFEKSDDGIIYFDATACLSEKGEPSLSVDDFKTAFAFWIHSSCGAYGISAEDVIVRDERSGRLFIEESLALVFMAYLDPGFAVYMVERISEMLLTGMALSDTALIMMARERLTVNDLMQKTEK